MSIAWYALQPIGVVTDMLLVQRDIRNNKNIRLDAKPAPSRNARGFARTGPALTVQAGVNTHELTARHWDDTVGFEVRSSRFAR